jgi:ABC-type transport system substrate-binding protein
MRLYFLGLIMLVLHSCGPKQGVSIDLTKEKLKTDHKLMLSGKKIFPLLRFRQDDASQRTAADLHEDSHIKVFLPSLAYLYVSHSINGVLLRPANNARGWDWDLATSYQQISDTVYEFKLRQEVVFQDGTPFNADAVVLNMKYFKKQPYLYTKIDQVFSHCEKVDDYTVRMHLKEKYSQFINDLIWVVFYTKEYLDKFGWNGKATAPNLAEPGLYGLGPYILKEGYVEGDRHTPEVVLEANPLYWNKKYPKVKKVTIYTEMEPEKALKAVTRNEGKLDITPIPYSAKVETILSPYSKLLSSPSTNNWAIHMNLRTGNKRLLDRKVRVALNQAIHQGNLLNFVYDQEGHIKPTLVSPMFPIVRDVLKDMKAYSQISDPYGALQQEKLKKILNGLELKVITQQRFMFLWKGLAYQLQKVGVKLIFDITHTEKYVFKHLLSTNAGKNSQDWDLLIWGCDDWHNHPWSAFFVYRSHNYWSTIAPDPVSDAYIEDFFREAQGSPEYKKSISNIIHHAFDNGYMLFVPAPNNVLAVNKEVIYHPWKMAVIPLWEIQITKDHWSVRDGEYSEKSKKPIAFTHYKEDEQGRLILNGTFGSSP